MCGIIGYIGKKDAFPILIDGLKKLEYRGYDSAGIAIQHDNILSIQRDVGKISDINFLPTYGNIGIGHTRWATHGEVTKENAHPHTDCWNKIAIVHNGTISNYSYLKKRLERNNHKFVSDTDSEVIAHLIEQYRDGGESFEESCISAFAELEGSFAILAINSSEQKIIGSRKDSPLVLGLIGDSGYVLGSDVPAFLCLTNNVIYLKNKDVVIISNNLYKIYSLEDGCRKMLERPVQIIDLSISGNSKGDFKHYLLKEVREQSEVIERAISQDRFKIDLIATKIKNAIGSFLIGSGSSYHACLTGAYLFANISSHHINPVIASEFLNYKKFLRDESLILAISQSGETADVLNALAEAKLVCKPKIISITNVHGSSIHENSDMVLYNKAGPEISVLSTKTYTSQVLLMSMLAHAVGDKCPKFLEMVKELYLEIFNLTSHSMIEHIDILSDRLKDVEHIYLIGRGLQYPTALEAALKIKEVAYIHAEALAGGELKHGTLALIDKGTPCIVFIGNDENIITNAMEIKSRSGYIIGVGSKHFDFFDFWIKTPEVEDMNPIVQIIPMQILAYQLAVKRGLDPDRPRNLAKSVTVL